MNIKGKLTLLNLILCALVLWAALQGLQLRELRKETASLADALKPPQSQSGPIQGEAADLRDEIDKFIERTASL